MRWCYLVYPVYKTIKGLQNAGILWAENFSQNYHTDVG
jgi:hypothetical protein